MFIMQTTSIKLTKSQNCFFLNITGHSKISDLANYVTLLMNMHIFAHQVFIMLNLS